MAGTLLGASAPSLFFMSHPRPAVSDQDAACPPGRAFVNVLGCCRPRKTIKPMADHGGAA